MDTSSSHVDVLQKLGYSGRGGNHRTLKERIKQDNLCEEKLNSNRKVGQINEKISTDEILVENSNYDRQNLKKRLISENLLDYKCSGCGLTKCWNGKELKLQLDHINGVNNDNRLENLRFLCPNCHSQTSTYAGKGNKRKPVERSNKVNGTNYFCKSCNEPKNDYYSELCKPCSDKKQRKVKDRPSIEQLQKDVDELGYSGTGRKYGVSDNAIRKWMK